MRQERNALDWRLMILGSTADGPVRAGMSGCLAAPGKRVGLAAQRFSGWAAKPVFRPAEDYTDRLARAWVLV